ncbi:MULTISPECIES: TonB-dependent receptor [unclassified Pseudomonas]|uniref:TonB-dependent receptor n=1 Tax=unclassified Pseudomonas TaxID=196821 RepID=UPI00244A69F1|nr:MULTISPECIES: TonB-dependent receptor [unclassified Pseudomonas]MDG9926522.1 TonB-dependent receptor [Pseudomonas sp. GD04042]MDH0481394.1 TonB-dependent receptor [Pseudomonas sp. GD04015]MDH0603343.1 TonB-dependent receptor [Pseudomonas sp. GD03869]
MVRNGYPVGIVLLSCLGGTQGLSAAEAAPALVLDEVKVSARHREESAQQVPIALTVLDGEQLNDAGIYRTEDMQQRAPSLLVSAPNARYTSYGIRGLGSSSFNDGIDGSVGVFLDGVYLGRQGMSLYDLVDLQRVEVLRGPQGTLYGKNTSAGAINISSRAPTFEPEGSAEVSFGEHGLRQYRGTVSGALVDGVLAGRLTGYDVERDGLIDNVYDGSELRDQNRQGLRGQLLWTPSDSFSARLIGEYGWQDEHTNVFMASNYSQATVKRAAFLGYRQLPIAPYARRVQQDEPNTIKTLQTGLTLELEGQLANGATLTSITGYRDWAYDADQDGDGTALSIAQNVAVRLDHHQFSQELRLADSPNEHFDYVAGLYYLRQSLDRELGVRFGDDAAAFFLGDRPELAMLGVTPGMIPPSLLDGARQTFDGEQRTDSRAVFGQVTWHATDRLDITPGLRYTRERKQGWLSRQVSGLAPLGPDPVSQIAGPLLRDTTLGGAYYRRDAIEESNLSGQLAASYRFADDLLGYASWSRGYKAGGINLEVIGPNVQPTFDAERVTSVEVGLKSSFWNDRAMLDLALYQADVDDYQALTNRAPANEYAPPIRDNLINVGKVRLRGIELDGLLRASERVDLRLGVAWSDARYRDFPNAPCSPSVAQWSCDLKGERLFNAPEWSATAGVDYRHPLEQGLELFGALDYSFRSGYYGTLEGGEGSYQPSYALTNLRLGLRRADRRWEAELWARNLFDEDYITAVYAQLGAGDYGVLTGDPRSLGVTLRTRW